MRDIQLFLRLLAERVYSARTVAGPVRDASDFAAWLHECSALAGSSPTMEEFFDRL
jgi:hypothetical protein